MLGLRIEYLTGRCVATTYNDRLSAEWPPHPARVFYAFVAAWAEHGADSDGRAALEWLAAQPPPAIAADAVPARRTVVTHFVPVNDTAVLKADFGALDDKIDAARREAQSLRADIDAEPKRRAALEAKHARAAKKVEQLRQQLTERRRADQQAIEVSSAAARSEATRLLPEGRGRQPRTFPSLTLSNRVVHLAWEGTPSLAVAAALDRLARLVTHVGHSSSLVACRLTDDVPVPTLAPQPSGEIMLRVPEAGLLARLEAAHERHRQVEPRVMPCRSERYGAPQIGDQRVVPSSVFDDQWIVFRQVGGPKLSAALAVEMTSALRGALMAHADQPVHEVLSGHTDDGRPTANPHVAFVALPWVGHEHASGSVLGLTAVLPRDIPTEQRHVLLRAVGRWEATQRAALGDAELESPPLSLRLGARGVVDLERVTWGGTTLQASLRPGTWARRSRTWITVTPIALDRNPGNLRSTDPSASAAAYVEAGRIVALGCERIGLPAPTRVDILPSVTLPGVMKARYYAPFPRDRRKPQRVLVHAALEFGEAVQGPVLVGAGRFFGLGLCRPLDEVVSPDARWAQQ